MATKGGVSRPRVGYREQGLGYFYQGRGMTTKGQLGMVWQPRVAWGGAWRLVEGYGDPGMHLKTKDGLGKGTVTKMPHTKALQIRFCTSGHW